MSLTRAAPYFPVVDLQAALAFYAHVLGFNAEYVAGDPPEFAIVSRDGLAIMLRLVATGTLLHPNSSVGGTWDAFFWVSNLDSLASEFTVKGASLLYGPTTQTYGMREFAVRDPAGYVLGFGEPER